MSRPFTPAHFLLPGIVTAGILAGAAGARNTLAQRGAEARILLLADTVLTAVPAPSPAPPGLAEREVIVNGATVPETEIQGGLLMRPLYADSVTRRSTSLVGWPADIPLQRHWHPVTEGLWMLSGSIAAADGGRVDPGQFWEAPAQVAMGPYTSTGSVFVFLGEGPFETHYLTAGARAPRAGEPRTVDPDTIPWRPLADLAGADAAGDVKVLRPGSRTDRGVYLLRLDGTATSPSLAYRASVEGYVLSGAVRLVDAYHDAHVLPAGYYFRIPAGSPFSLSSVP